MHSDVFLMGFLCFMLPFGFIWFISEKYTSYKEKAGIAGFVFSLLGFLAWWLIFDGIEGRSIGAFANRLTVISFAIIFGFGTFLAVFIASKLPDQK